MKRAIFRTLALLGVLLLTTVPVLPTVAYLQASTTSLTNTLREAQLDAEIIEDFTPADAQNLVPGQEVIKAPVVKNNGTIPAYMALCIHLQSDDATYTPAQIREHIELLNLPGEGWVYSHTDASGKDVYYCTEEIAPEGSTPPLFTGVRISSQWTDVCDFSLLLTAAAVQSVARTPSDAAALLP